MILEIATLDVRPGEEKAFEKAFEQAQFILSGMAGYQSHQLQRSIENPCRYVLLVNWRQLEDHTEGFRGAPEYEQWSALLHRFYDPFPTVEHFSPVYDGA